VRERVNAFGGGKARGERVNVFCREARERKGKCFWAEERGEKDKGKYAGRRQKE